MTCSTKPSGRIWSFQSSEQRGKPRARKEGGEEDLATPWATGAPGRSTQSLCRVRADFQFVRATGQRVNLSSPTSQTSVKSAAHKCHVLEDLGGNQRKGAVLGAKGERPAALEERTHSRCLENPSPRMGRTQAQSLTAAVGAGGMQSSHLPGGLGDTGQPEAH